MLPACRIIPVVVVVYRVLMVCYVDFCYTHGEKQIRDQLCRWPTQYYYKPIYSIYFTQFYLRLCLMFPLLMGGISVIYHHNLRCRICSVFSNNNIHLFNGTMVHHYIN